MQLGYSDYHKVPRKGLKAIIPGNIGVSGVEPNVDVGPLSQQSLVLFVPGQHPGETAVGASGRVPI